MNCFCLLLVARPFLKNCLKNELIESKMTSDDFKISKADYIIQQLNVQTAKKATFLLAFCFIVFHTFLHFHFGKSQTYLIHRKT